MTDMADNKMPIEIAINQHEDELQDRLDFLRMKLGLEIEARLFNALSRRLGFYPTRLNAPDWTHRAEAFYNPATKWTEYRLDGQPVIRIGPLAFNNDGDKVTVSREYQDLTLDGSNEGG